MAISTSFQKRFKKLVSELEYETLLEVAEKMKVSYATFSKILNYGIIPKTIILIRMADFFEVPLEFLLGITENKQFEKSQKLTSFKERFEELKILKNLSYCGISNKLNLSANYFSQWKNNSSYLPNIEILISLSKLFEVSLDYLLGRSDDK